MLKKTAIALSFAMVAGTAVAAQADSGMNVESSSAAGMSAQRPSDAALETQFNALDTNGDGAVSRAEAGQNPRMAEMYDSFDTSATIEGGAENTGSSGLSLDQFKAGMQAQSSQSGGVMGPAVSGGETYTVMEDGSKKMNQGSENMNQDASTRDSSPSMQESIQPQANEGMSGMPDQADDSMSSMPSDSQPAQGGATDNSAMDNPGAMRDEMEAQGNDQGNDEYGTGFSDSADEPASGVETGIDTQQDTQIDDSY